MLFGSKNKCRQEKQNQADGSMKGPKRDMAIQEVQSNGSSFDRIMSLENQLTQLSMEIDCKTAYPSSSDASCSSGYKIAERICSYPNFNNPLATYSLIKRNPLQVDINKKKSRNAVRQQPKKNGEHKTSSNMRRKSKIASSWPNMRLLGC